MGSACTSQILICIYSKFITSKSFNWKYNHFWKVVSDWSFNQGLLINFCGARFLFHYSKIKPVRAISSLSLNWPWTFDLWPQNATSSLLIGDQTRNVHNFIFMFFFWKYRQSETNWWYFYSHTLSGKYFYSILNIYRVGC